MILQLNLIPLLEFQTTPCIDYFIYPNIVEPNTYILNPETISDNHPIMIKWKNERLHLF